MSFKTGGYWFNPFSWGEDRESPDVMRQMDMYKQAGPFQKAWMNLGSASPNYGGDDGDWKQQGVGTFGKIGGFGSRFGTGAGSMRGFGRIGSYQSEEEPGQGLFGREGGFMSKFGTGEGLLSGLFGGSEGFGKALSQAGSSMLSGGGYQHDMYRDQDY